MELSPVNARASALRSPEATRSAQSRISEPTPHYRFFLEAILSIRAIREQCLPPTANLEQVADGCELDHVVGKARPARVRRVLSNSFGFGGTNGCLILADPDAGTA